MALAPKPMAADSSARRVAVVGAGWAGLAAAVDCQTRGDHVTLFDMAPQAGGRARSVQVGATGLDNGQHILIGAYRQTLALMRHVGVDPGQRLLRLALEIRYPDGSGLAMPKGPPMLSFARAVWAQKRWRIAQRLSLFAHAGRWALSGFDCDASWTVARLCRALPAPIREDLINPLCVAALNTPSESASARVLLRVLKDALFGGRGSADLLLPQFTLSGLLPTAALAWLQTQGADWRPSTRVMRLARDGQRWRVDGEAFDAVILACPNREAARLAQPVNAVWAATAAALTYQPIVTVWLRSAGLKLPCPMMALKTDAESPAQFAFDLGALGVADGVFSFVVSGAAIWVELGTAATTAAVLRQARSAFPGAFQVAAGEPVDSVVVHVATERRATFACVPGLVRPSGVIAAGLLAAGDYVAGPYPATIEGAVRSGNAAAQGIAEGRGEVDRTGPAATKAAN